MFFTTINFLEDPLGFPLKTKNQNFAKIMGVNIENKPKGFIYDDYDVKSWRSFTVAHESYHKARKIFSRAVVKSFSAGRGKNYNQY